MDKTLLIMAAGMGSRYGGLKQVDAMGPSGEILMEYSVYDALMAGFSQVVFIVKEGMKQSFHQNIGSRLSSYIQVDYAVQSLDNLPEGYDLPQGRKKPWGTSHAILSAADIVKNPFVVLNADDYYGRETFSVLGRFLDSLDITNFQAAMVGFPLEKTLSKNGYVSRAICRIEKGCLKDIEELQNIAYNPRGQIESKNHDNSMLLQGNELCSMNIWGFTPHIFEYLDKDFIRFLNEKGDEEKSEWLIPETVGDIIRKEIAQVKVLQSSDSWFGVTYPEDKSMVTVRISELVQKGLYPTPLFKDRK